MKQQQSSWTLLVPYRETDPRETGETIAIDEKTIVIGIQSLADGAVKPLRSETDGRKLRYIFDREEALDKYRLLQMALGGTLPSDKKVHMDFAQMVVHEQGWINSLAMMRNIQQFVQ